jgi:hypothetical protein
MNSARGSTPPNPNLDLPSRSTDFNKTLGIIGTPHEESIAKFNPTRTCPKRRNQRNPAKNTSNPRTRKTRKSSPFTHGFGKGITAQRTTKGSHKFPPSNPQEKGLENNPKKSPREGSETTQRNHQEITGSLERSLLVFSTLGGLTGDDLSRLFFTCTNTSQAATCTCNT